MGSRPVCVRHPGEIYRFLSQKNLQSSKAARCKPCGLFRFRLGTCPRALCKQEVYVSVPAAYLGIILIWSTTPLAIKWSGEEVGFLFGVTGRMLLGVIAGMLVARLLGVRLPWHARARRTYLAAGLGLFFAMLSVYWSSQFIPSGWISVIFGLAPLVTGLMATLWLSENVLTPARIAGMLLGLGGLVFMLTGAETLGPDAVYGISGVLLSVIAYSASSVGVKRIQADIPALAVTLGGLLVYQYGHGLSEWIRNALLEN